MHEAETFQCTKCKGYFPKAAFRPRKDRSDGITTHCRICLKAAAKAYRERTRTSRRERDREFSRISYHKNPHKHRDRFYRSTYGLSLADFNTLSALQGDKCDICKNPCDESKHLVIDHDHKTGAIRGLLCHKCNRALGLFKDNIYSLHAAIEYLTSSVPEIIYA